MSRKELLKSPDEFITITTRVFQWLREYSKWVTGAVIGLIVVGVAVWGWKLQQDRRESRADDLQAQAYQLYRNATSQTDEESSRQLLAKAVERFQEVIQEFKGTQAALMARIYRGHACYALGRYEEATKDYEEALEKASAVGIQTLALQGMGYALMAQDDLQRAITTFKELQHRGGAGFQRWAQWNIARCLEGQGKVQEALKIYREMEQSFPDMVHRLMAQVKVQELSPNGEGSP